jgi:S-adenosylmethionine decarboxylase
MKYNNIMEDGSYGIEVFIDLHKCNTEKFTKDGMVNFVNELIQKADMQAFGDPVIWEDFDQTEPHLKGISIFQWIHTSNIVVHALSMTQLAMVNLFTCKPFNCEKIVEFAKSYFEAEQTIHKISPRGLRNEMDS